MEALKKISLIILAFILGYTVMVIGLYLSQDAFFGGIVIGRTKLWQLAIAGVGALLSAFVGGYVTGLIAPVKNYIPQFILAGETVIESIYLYVEGAFPNPLWFDIMSEMTLLVGIFGGGYFYLKRHKSRGIRPSLP